MNHFIDKEPSPRKLKWEEEHPTDYIFHPSPAIERLRKMAENEEGKNNVGIYFAASLFNGREKLFNVELAGRLEKMGYKVNLPQRDGFEFSNLERHLYAVLPKEEVAAAVKDIIYLLDMGVLMPKSDIVLANWDEPIDEGVVVEASYARVMGKFVIGYRTDVRSPYGNLEEPLGGVHFFPAYQCDVFIPHYVLCRGSKEAGAEIDRLAEKIAGVMQSELPKREKMMSRWWYMQERKPPLQKYKHTPREEENLQWEEEHTAVPNFVSTNYVLESIQRAADILFSGIEDIHSDKGLEEVAKRYVEHKDRLSLLAPKVIR